jgi:hypothetical protein
MYTGESWCVPVFPLFFRVPVFPLVFRPWFSEVYPLADRVARGPENDAAASELRVLLERVLTERPELRPQGDISITTGDITADNGSVGAGVVTGNITIHNK